MNKFIPDKEMYEVDPMDIEKNVEERFNKNSREFKTAYQTAKRLNEVLIDKGISRDRLMALCGFSKAAVSNYLTGKRDIPLNLILTLKEEYGLSLDYLLGYTDSEIQNPKIDKITDITGLNTYSINTLKKYKKDKDQYINILNLLFSSKMMEQLLKIIDGNCQYLKIYNIVKGEQENSETKATIDRQINFINWTYIEKISMILRNITEMMSKAYQTEYTFPQGADREKIEKNIEHMNRQIDKLRIFYLTENEDGE